MPGRKYFRPYFTPDADRCAVTIHGDRHERPAIVPALRTPLITPTISYPRYTILRNISPRDLYTYLPVQTWRFILRLSNRAMPDMTDGGLNFDLSTGEVERFLRRKVNINPLLYRAYSTFSMRLNIFERWTGMLKSDGINLIFSKGNSNIREHILLSSPSWTSSTDTLLFYQRYFPLLFLLFLSSRKNWFCDTGVEKTRAQPRELQPRHFSPMRNEPRLVCWHSRAMPRPLRVSTTMTRDCNELRSDCAIPRGCATINVEPSYDIGSSTGLPCSAVASGCTDTFARLA